MQESIKSRYRQSELLGAIGLSIFAAGVTLIPYLVSSLLTKPGDIFSGFLLNPGDGFTYLAKMRQGWLGEWTFTLPYATDPGSGTYLYPLYLALGHISRWTMLPLISVFHFARVLSAGLMYFAAYLFLRKVLPSPRARWSAFLLILFGSGFGWIAFLFDIGATDILMPESTPFLSAFVNPHFPLASAAILLAMFMLLEDQLSLGIRFVGSVVSGTIIGAVAPFTIAPLVLIQVGWLMWELAVCRGEEQKDCGAVRKSFWPISGVILAAAPWLVYGLSISLTHPVISVWMAQNQTPSPPPYQFAIGFGLVLALAIIGLVTGRKNQTRAGRLILLWAAINMTFLYLPIGLQRRTAMGLFFPLAALAGSAIGRWRLDKKGYERILLIMLLLSMPSNLLVVGVGLAGVRQGDAWVVLSEDEILAFHWLEENAPRDSIVLASPEIGNRLPAFAAIRVVYGHPYETPNAAVRLEQVRYLYRKGGDTGEKMELLREIGVDFVFYGPRERRMGQDDWLENLRQEFESGSVRIFAVG